jgi:hypothetical protein
MLSFSDEVIQGWVRGIPPNQANAVLPVGDSNHQQKQQQQQQQQHLSRFIIGLYSDD